ncbi:uncharacterized protein [Diabrotica undecimpunctata]|uniref:uncharacterized protein n=1 Tax=Diabrotica undecimpunctata TaxID=50387 RepID=UPI003B6340F1
MKYLFFILASLVSTGFCAIRKEDLGPVLTSKISEWRKKCQLFTGISDEKIDQMIAGNFPDCDEAKRYNYCIWMIENFTINKKNKMCPKKIEYVLPPKYKADSQHFLKCNKEHVVEDNSTTSIVDKFYNMQMCVQKCVPDSHYIYF